jgi:sporulation integral membrane protein YtvI
MWPVLTAIALAILTEPAVRRVQHLGFSRRTAVLTVELATLGASAAGTALLGQAALSQLPHLARQAAAVATYVTHLTPSLPPVLTSQVTERLWHLSDITAAAASSLLRNLVTGVPAALASSLILGVTWYLLASDLPGLSREVLALLPAPWREPAAAAASSVARSLQGWIRALLTVMAISATITSLALAALRVRYALAIGLLAGVLETAPVLGPALLFVPWIAWHLLQGNARLALELAAIYLILYAIRQTVEPRLVAAQLGIHPLASLLSMYVAAKALGPMWIPLGPVAVATLGAIRAAGLTGPGGPGRGHPPPRSPCP